MSTNNTAINDVLSSILHVTPLINFYAAFPFLFFGTIGNLFTIIVFSRKALRSNPCVVYLLATAIPCTLALYFAYIVKISQNLGFDLTTISAFCKMRMYIIDPSQFTSSWFMVLACIDRYASSSEQARIRNFSRLSMAYRLIIIVTLIGCCIYTYIFHCYDSHVPNSPIVCYIRTDTTFPCYIFDSVIFFALFSTIPPVGMIIFGGLTFFNIRKMHSRQIEPLPSMVTTANRSKTRQQLDLKILRMLFAQVLMLIFSTMPLSMYKVYSTATMYLIKSQMRRAIENLLFQIVLTLSNLNNVTIFYLYLLSGPVFRRELMKLFK
ncbi:unnamed protein product [Didymodactylos carnosus]|uniref:G-protein coupled receptors family 1 profile domain-containing protein n=1 Tax=Didymodactylos carnosus TaxID=1234261 RepID=A0A815MJW6_9BILA|nr:unnamed protein product [Didymodactylos carnosus]CAF1420537.1 unnamed protein product [Didymodactylos carnosus]CAF4084309.1 unnamed protein product [Didymodactylos carnosus]CAF4304001.1 unnamed protein product [Didymodactylos carnosus]